MNTYEAQPGADSRPASDQDNEKRVIEALIFVSDAPITLEQMAQVLPARSPSEIRALVDEIQEELQASNRALRIEEVAGGFRYSTRPELAPWIRTYFRNRNRTRLSPAGIETLAVIAYKQPVTAPEIQEIRGVDSQAAIRTLLEKRLVRISGRKKIVGRPFLYTTTSEFLLHFGLASIEDLPPIEDFERLAGEIADSEIREEADLRAGGTITNLAPAGDRSVEAEGIPLAGAGDDEDDSPGEPSMSRARRDRSTIRNEEE